MKKHFLLALGFTAVFGTVARAQQQDPILMEIDGKKITKSEFLQIYLKNNNNPKYDQKTLDEYIDLFKKFQLKVAEAEALGYDTIPKLKNELAGYQKQLAQPYLTDKSMNEALVKQAYERMKNEVRASHILIKLPANPSPEDTLKAYNKAMEVRSKLLKGGDFNKVASEYSDDPSAKTNFGDLGFFTAFQMVYPFEEAAYNQKIGEISMPIRTRFGYHILKVTDKRPARGTMKAAHLMVAANEENDSPETIAKAESKINELYEKLKKGDNFEELVKAYSDDPSSANNGGLLPVFGTGATTRMIPEFEEAAFGLEKDGDFSKPVRSKFGFHIIKRIQLTPLKSFDELKKEMETRVSRDERANLTQNSYIEKLKKEYNYSEPNHEKVMTWFNKNMDSSIYKGEFNAGKLKSNAVMFSLAGKIYTEKDFVTYMNENPRNSRGAALSEVASKQFKEWTNSTVVDYEKSRLDVKYPEYKALMKEYHDGILLYEVMSDKVWNKAMTDTVGLKAYYEANKTNYVWGKRFDCTVYETMSGDVAKKVYKLAKKKLAADSIASIINKNTELNLKVRSGKFELSKTPYLEKQSLKKGVNKPYVFEGKNYVVKLNEVIEAKNKELAEAKGIITSDYQTYLEKEWLAELEKKHKIVVYKDVLYSIGK